MGIPAGGNVIGLQAFLSMQQFTKAVADYTRQVQGLVQQNAQLSQSSAAAGTTADTKGAAGMLAMGAAAGVAMAAVSGLISMITGLVKAIASAASSGLILGARFDEIRLSAQLMGQRAGKTEEEVDDLADSLKEAGIRTDIAFGALTQLARMEMDMAMAEGLADVAKNAAVLAQGGADTSDTMDRLIYGIQFLRPRVLATAGVIIKGAEAYEMYAATIDKSAEALTTAEKQQALYQAVLKEGVKIQGIYETAMLNAGKQWRSFIGRELPELRAGLADTLQPAFLTVVQGIRSMATSFSEAIAEGGRLHGMMVNIGAIVSIVADAVMAMAKRAMEALMDFSTSFSDGLASTAESAFEWGVEISVALADGIIRGAHAALTVAMNVVGSILSWFLSPGSPPKVAPDLDIWGISAINSWLHGFTQGDFDILKGIQGPLQKAMGLLGMGSGEQLDILSSITESLGTGQVDASFFNDIAEAAGVFGQDIAELAMAQMQLATSVEAVAAAEADLASAREDHANATQDITDLTAEYNAALRGGKTPATDLEAKFAAIKAAEDEQAAAAEAVVTAEEAVGTRKDDVAMMQEQLKMQKQLVDQLLKMADLQQKATAEELGIDTKDAAAKAKAAGAGIGEDLAAGIAEGMAAGMPDLGDMIAEKVAEAKKRLKVAIKDLMRPFHDALLNDWMPLVDDVEHHWKGFTKTLRVFWRDTIIPIADWTNEYLLTPLKNVWKFIRENILPVIKSFAKMIKDSLIVQFKSLWFVLTDIVLPALGDLWDMFNVKLREALEFLGVDVETLGTKMSTWKVDVLDVIVAAFDGLKRALSAINDLMGRISTRLANFNFSALDPFIGQSPSPLAIGLKAAREQFRSLANMELPMLRAQFNMMSNMQPAMASSSVINTSSQSTTINMGGQTMQNGMDVSMVEGIVMRLLRTR